jgi:hypothetical protein
MTLQSLFSPVVGQPVWGGRRTHGSCMFLEFGPPRAADAQHGSWSLLVEFCDYVVDCGRERFTHDDTDQALIRRCLMALEGRKLVAAGDGQVPHALALRFDGGGSMLLMPSSAVEFGPDTGQWLLWLPDGRSVGYSNGGVFDAT